MAGVAPSLSSRVHCRLAALTTHLPAFKAPPQVVPSLSSPLPPSRAQESLREAVATSSRWKAALELHRRCRGGDSDEGGFEDPREQIPKDPIPEDPIPEDPTPEEAPIRSFRATAVRDVELLSAPPVNEVARAAAGGAFRRHGWRASMKDFNVEVCLTPKP